MAVTAAFGGVRSGQIAVSVHGASIVPQRPRLTAALWKRNLTHDLVRDSGAFAVHLLSNDQDEVVYVARSTSLRHLHTGYLQGSRVQAHLSAAGLVILGALGPNYWDAWLARTTLRPYSSHTVLDKEHLRQSFALAREHGLTPVQMALAFCYTNWRVASTIIGVTSVAQLDEDLDAWGTTLSPELMAEIDKVRWEMRDPAV